jgi:hypothetical protein
MLRHVWRSYVTALRNFETSMSPATCRCDRRAFLPSDTEPWRRVDASLIKLALAV